MLKVHKTIDQIAEAGTFKSQPGHMGAQTGRQVNDCTLGVGGVMSASNRGEPNCSDRAGLQPPGTLKRHPQCLAIDVIGWGPPSGSVGTSKKECWAGVHHTFLNQILEAKTEG